MVKTHIHLMRHGAAYYRQGETHLVKANDLTPLGIEVVRSNTRRLVKEIQPNEVVQILSSGYGRALHTAKHVAAVLTAAGIKQRTPIKSLRRLNEVRNFSWPCFRVLVEGGEVEGFHHDAQGLPLKGFRGMNFSVDRRLTNPYGLDAREYFQSDAAHVLTLKAREELPTRFLDRIATFETCAEATMRVVRVLEPLRRLRDRLYRIILVTHDGPSGHIVRQASDGKKLGLEPGESIKLHLA